VHGRAPRRRHGADQHLTADAGVEDLLRELAPRVLGVLVRRYEDFAVCEDAVQDALVAAAQHWTKEGVPKQPAVVAGHRRQPRGGRRVAQRARPPPPGGGRRRAGTVRPGGAVRAGRLPRPAADGLPPRAAGALPARVDAARSAGSHHLSMCLPRHQVSAFQPLLTRWSHSNIEPYGWDLSRATSGYSSAGP